MSGQNFDDTINSIVCSGAADVSVAGCIFIDNSSGSVNVSASGAGTAITMEGCNFNCYDDETGIPSGTAAIVTTGASMKLESCAIQGAVLGIQCGSTGDTSSTFLNASGTVLTNCISDIQQNGSSTLQFFGGVFIPESTSINDPTNVSFAAFDDEAILTIGTNANVAHTIYESLNGQSPNEPILSYQPSYYGNQGTVYINRTTNNMFNGTQADGGNANYYVITNNRNQSSSLNLISDTGAIGSGSNVRGWSISKVGTSADLAFTYTNNDTSGQSAIGATTVMQLDGFNNQVDFPIATTSPLPTNTVAKLVWAGDTDLYRYDAGILKTDGNFAIGGLTSSGIVHNDASGNLSTSLIVNADISNSAGITDNKLATISTPGKVANSATTATSSNTPNTIVLRDASGNFSAGTITASLTGTASANVLKTGDTMTGNLNFADQTGVLFQDSTGDGNYVGLNAPAVVSSSYTLNLPGLAPTAGQVLQATSASTTTWATLGGSPAAAETYYVSKSGSDSNNGSFFTPFATVAHAVSVANTISSLTNPIVINVGPGEFTENNSGGPITITADGVSIIGSSNTGTIIIPSTLSNDLFKCTTANILFLTLGLNAVNLGSTASGINITAGTGQGGFQSLIISNFQTGISANGAGISTELIISSAVSLYNNTGVSVNNARAIIQACVILGGSGSTPENTAFTITGTSALVTMIGNSLRLLNTGASISNGGNTRILSTNFETTTTGIIATGASTTAIVGCNFIENISSSVNVFAYGASTGVTVEGCNFNGSNNGALSGGTPEGTAVKVSSGANLNLASCSIQNAALGMQCGDTGDTSSTVLNANGTVLTGCAIDIQQNASSTLQFFGGGFSPALTIINNPANVSFAAFDEQAILAVGTNSNMAHTVYEILNGANP